MRRKRVLLKSNTTVVRGGRGPRARRWLCLLAGAWILGAQERARAQVVINEVLAFNSLTNVDDEGENSDWLELLNIGEEPVDLTGHSLTDNMAQPRKWVLPSTVLAPGEHLLVWCSAKDRDTIPLERVLERHSRVPFEPSLISANARWHYLVGTSREKEKVRRGTGIAPGSTIRNGGRGRRASATAMTPRSCRTASGTVFLRHAFEVDRRPTGVVSVAGTL